MALETVTHQSEAPEARRLVEEPLYKPMSMYREEARNASLPGGAVCSFAENVSDIAGGVRVILRLSIDNDLRRQNRADADEPRDDDRPLIGEGDLWFLQRMAAAAMERLEASADSMMEWAYEEHTPEGRAENRSRARAVAGVGTSSAVPAAKRAT